MTVTSKRAIRVRFFGKSRGFSGYAQATRNIAKAFSESNIPVLFKPKESFYEGLSTYNGACDVDFYIQTPPFSRHKSKNYKIGYFYWETDTLPVAWGRDICSSLDEIWAPCHLTKKACRKAGFRGPIEVIHTPGLKEDSPVPLVIPARGADNLAIGGDTFVFYSIFQWNERKGYRKLLRAYYEEFSSKDKVILFVKTNPIKHKDHGVAKIKDDILRIKSFCKNKASSPVFLVTSKVSNSYIAGIHEYGDCFVLPHHGEGWGMPIHDAMTHNSLVITTGFGGITEHLNDSNSLLIAHKLVEVKPMNWNPYYGYGQKWAEPDISHLKSLMRKAYEGTAEQGKLTDRAARVAESMSIAAFSRGAENILGQKRFLNLIGSSR